MSQQKCATCSIICRGKKCKTCYRQGANNRSASCNEDNGVTHAFTNSLCLKDILSTETLNLNESGIPTNDEGTLFSNPSFRDGSLVDVEYIATTVDVEESSQGDGVPFEKFSLIQLISKMVEQHTAPLLKKISDLEKANKTLSADLEELKKQNNSNQNGGAASDTQIKECSDNLKTIKATVAAQQKTIEDLQKDKRAKNMIITGVPESAGVPSEARKADQAAVESIFTAVECPGVCASRVTRLGKKQEVQGDDADAPRDSPPPPRPLLVSLNTAGDVRAVLTKTYNLKEKNEFKNVYIKRDEHPLVRKEWRRLREFARKEKEAPINAGCIIKIDYQKKAVTRNGESILDFVSPFRSAGPNHSE